MKDKLDYLEGQSKRNNVIIYGVKENPARRENWQDTENIVLDIIKNHTEVNLSGDMVERCHRIGSTTPDKRHPRPIVLKLQSFKKREEILRSFRDLKAAGFTVTEHYSEQVKVTRDKLKYHLRRAKEDGCSAYLRYDKLIVNGQSYTLQQCISYEESSRNSNPPPTDAGQSMIRRSARDPRVVGREVVNCVGAEGGVGVNDGKSPSASC